MTSTNSGRRTFRRRLWLFVLATLVLASSVAMALWARERGWITWDRYQFSKNSMIRMQVAGRPLKDGQVRELPEGEFTVTCDAIEDDATALGIQDELVLLVGTEPGQVVGHISVLFERLNYEGQYRQPYRKSGRCEFKLRTNARLVWKQHKLELDGEFEGHLEFKADGFCAVRTLKREVGRALGKKINEEISGKFLGLR